MATAGEHIDKPEPRWQALLAFIAVGGIYLRWEILRTYMNSYLLHFGRQKRFLQGCDLRKRMGTRMDVDDVKFALKRSWAATSDQGHKSGLVAPALGSPAISSVAASIGG